jgi:hypothetical protein
MFEDFLARYPRASQAEGECLADQVPSLEGFPEFMANFGGASYGGGVYRVVSASEIVDWNARIMAAYPEFADQITCFAYDWLGRAFALNQNRLEDGRPGVTMFEPGTGEALEIPCNLLTFHSAELLEYGEAALAISFFEDWLSTGGAAPSPDQCVGYKKPLFLGGVDGLENLELADLDVYWHLSAQLIRQTRGLPLGTVVSI